MGVVSIHLLHYGIKYQPTMHVGIVPTKLTEIGHQLQTFWTHLLIHSQEQVSFAHWNDN